MKYRKGDKEEKLKEDLMDADIEDEEDQVEMGMKVEQEHKDLTKGDPKKTRMIVDAHLKEDEKYYTHLKHMEAKHGKHKED